MKYTDAFDIFESNKFCYFFGRLINFNFLTIDKSHCGKYRVYTSKYDHFKFYFGLLFFSFVFFESQKENAGSIRRSIIFDIGTYFTGRIEAIQPILSILQFYYFRKEYYKILSSMQWIDDKVYRHSDYDS